MRAVLVCALLAVSVLLSCGAARPLRPRTAGCIEPESSVEWTPVLVGATVSIAPPCPQYNASYIDGPVIFTVKEEGLRVQMNVRDETFVPGPYREPRCDRSTVGPLERRCERDAVVVFPNGALPGATAIELETSPRPEGYSVDETLPWSTFTLNGPTGRFRVVISVLERGPSGAENETRISTMIRIDQPQDSGVGLDATAPTAVDAAMLDDASAIGDDASINAVSAVQQSLTQDVFTHESSVRPGVHLVFSDAARPLDGR